MNYFINKENFEKNIQQTPEHRNVVTNFYCEDCSILLQLNKDAADKIKISQITKG